MNLFYTFLLFLVPNYTTENEPHFYSIILRRFILIQRNFQTIELFSFVEKARKIGERQK